MTKELQKYIEYRESDQWGWEDTYRKRLFKDKRTDSITYDYDRLKWLLEHYSMLLKDALDALEPGDTRQPTKDEITAGIAQGFEVFLAKTYAPEYMHFATDMKNAVKAGVKSAISEKTTEKSVFDDLLKEPQE